MFSIFKSKKRRQLEIVVEMAKNYNELAAMKRDIEARGSLAEEQDTLDLLVEGMAAIAEMPYMEKVIAKQEDEIEVLFKQLGI